MTFPLAGIVVRRLATLTVALVLLAFAGVAAAVADTHDEDATARDTMYEVEVLDDVVIEPESTEPESTEPEGEDDSDDSDDDNGSVTSTQTSDEACTPMLVTYRADSSTGDTEAVALTARAEEFGVAGWVNVGWQAAEGAQLTAVTITATDGTITTRTSDPESGSALDVLELRFCGTYDGEVSIDAGPPPSEDRDDTAVDSEPATDDEPAPRGSTGSSGSGSNTSGSAGTSGGTTGSTTTGSGTGGSTATTTADDSDEATDSSDDGDDSTDDEEPLGVVSVPLPDNGDDELDDTDATMTADTAEPETEVLGVQLTQESSTDERGWLVTAIGLLLLALVAGGGAFLGFRRLRV